MGMKVRSPTPKSNVRTSKMELSASANPMRRCNTLGSLDGSLYSLFELGTDR